ncbi:MAG: nitrate reductase associated protein [Cyanobacteria bacterium P01_F01_bin.4]
METGGFQFEQEFIDSLRCIPMQVRLNLDTCGVKLKLKHWHQFSQAERRTLMDMACDTQAAVAAYQTYLQSLVTHYTGQPAKEIDVLNPLPWLENTPPEQLQQQAASHGLTITPDRWQRLTPPQRFALIKLSRPGHENRNFVPAMEEFGLVVGRGS